MSDLAPILDYASPRRRVKLRLPSRSVLRRSRVGGQYTVTETLSGKREALAALLFAAFVMCVEAGTIYSEWACTEPFELLFFAGMLLAIVIVWLLVLHNSWRKTVLRVDAKSIAVSTSAPLSRSRHHASEGVSPAQVEVVVSGLYDGLGEFRLYRAPEPDIHLFTDHPQVDLRAIHAEITGLLEASLAGADVQ